MGLDAVTGAHATVVTLTVGADAMDDGRSDTQWLTYDELAQLRGIARDSAIRLAMRRHWARRTGNDGKARVAVPVGDDMPTPDVAPVVLPDITPDESSIVRGVGADALPLVDVLRSQVADLVRRLDAAEDERGRLLALVERLTEREAEGNGLNRVKSIGADAAERRAAELQAIIDGELAGLRAMMAALVQREQMRTADSVPAPESQRRVPPRRRGWLGMLLGVPRP